MKYIVFVLLLIVGYLQYKLWFDDGNLIELHHSQQEVFKIKDKNAKLKKRNDALDAEINDLKFGKNAIEERSRSELGMIKSDEVYYHIVDKEKI